MTEEIEIKELGGGPIGKVVIADNGEIVVTGVTPEIQADLQKRVDEVTARGTLDLRGGYEEKTPTGSRFVSTAKEVKKGDPGYAPAFAEALRAVPGPDAPEPTLGGKSFRARYLRKTPVQ